MLTITTRRILIGLVLSQVWLPALAAASLASVCAPPPQYVRLHVVNDAGAPPETLRAAAREASEIWKRVGLQLAWTFPPTVPDAAGGRTVIVVIRRHLTPVASVNVAATKGRVRTPLGWLVFDGQGRAGNLIEVSFDQVTTLVRRGLQRDVPISVLAELARHRALGRGLGRVIAHEIGHWLMGRGHVDSGLMKARFRAQDLVDVRLPDLPPFWTARGDDAAMPPCAPMALRRLGADRSSR